MLRGLLIVGMIAGMLFGIMTQSNIISVYAQGKIIINGAGATFPFPLIDTWRVDYQTVNPNVDINYQSIGSGGGVKQFTEKTVDFGASDAPLTPRKQQRYPGQFIYLKQSVP